MEEAVRKAREVMVGRLGADRGVPVLCSGGKKVVEWIVSGLQSARPGSPQCLLYGGGAGEEEVRQWVQGRRLGREVRDLVTTGAYSRGWEADCVIVVDTADSEGMENLVLRGMVMVAVVRMADSDSVAD